MRPPREILEKNLDEMPDLKTDEVVLYMTAQNFVDLYYRDRKFDLSEFPWLRKPFISE